MYDNCFVCVHFLTPYFHTQQRPKIGVVKAHLVKVNHTMAQLGDIAGLAYCRKEHSIDAIGNDVKKSTLTEIILKIRDHNVLWGETLLKANVVTPDWAKD